MSDFFYSDKFSDDQYDYRYVIVSGQSAKKIPPDRLLTEEELKNIGIKQSPGWIHYDIYKPEPNILLFRRPKTDSKC